ncbi:uncharacterized protein LOC107856406 [Capsicum annuum]|uniref:uncharacterized protein LOC107856406 n=1 Tax=Capsicum annuum TaxID=4072 RepID=UPI0007BF98E4|nr:uncharacterized protein LOC107856406 [Capsicum annuum]
MEVNHEVSQPLMSIFTGEKYEFWSIKMKTLFKSQGVWELVQVDFVDQAGSDEEAEKLKGIKKNDAKALLLIQQAVHDTIFARIAEATTSSEAWKILKKEFQGSARMITVKLQTYRHDFETLFMKSNESVQTYLSRVSSLVNQIKSYGEDISEETIVAKVLRSLTPKFEHIAAIEESHNLSDYTFVELISSLQAHEVRILRSHEKNEEKAFQVKGESTPKKDKFENFANRGQGRDGFRGRGRGRGQERSKDRGGSNEEKHNRTFLRNYCRKPGHKEAYCWQKQKDENSQASFAEINDGEKVSMVEKCAIVATGDNETRLWHLRYGHLNVNGLKLLIKKEMVFGLPKVENLDFCESCVYGKQSKKVFPIGKSWRASKFKSFVERQSGCRLKTLWTNRGGEFISKEFSSFCEENKIHRELTTPFTSEQNGVAERKNRTIVEMGRRMMEGRSLPKCFWAEAVATTVYFLNISLTKVVNNQTPYEAWRGNKPKAYKLYNPVSGKITVNRNVVFNEDSRWNFNSKNECSNIQLLPSDNIVDQEYIADHSLADPGLADPIFFKDAKREDKWCKAMEEELLAIQKNQT